MNSSDKIVLFDGVCNFCESSVQFIIKYDRTKSIQFASIQSQFGSSQRTKYNIPDSVDSIIFIENNQALIKSDAAIAIANYFPAYLRWIRIFSIIPKFVRDKVYDIIAKNRYRIFGKKDTCMLPSPEIRARFIEI